MKRVYLLALLVALLSAGPALAETRYVTDQTEVPMRTGETAQYRIKRMLPSGTPVEVLGSNAGSGYSRVRTEDGTIGFVLTRDLITEPSARDRVATLEARLEELQKAPDQLAVQLTRLKGEHEALQVAHASLSADKSRIEQELATIRQASANVLRITEERTELRKSVADLTRQVAELEQANRDLTNQANQRWFLIGAGVVAGGILLGLILPHLRFRRRKSSWGTL
ncbi:MAG: TIGR04211 family SH3 domain-containing protein [Chromatiaceae bacterium]|nr:TIGR04211 family SH3 domain-containing protein [Chromatiaceae bacterium]